MREFGQYQAARRWWLNPAQVDKAPEGERAQHDQRKIVALKFLRLQRLQVQIRSFLKQTSLKHADSAITPPSTLQSPHLHCCQDCQQCQSPADRSIHSGTKEGEGEQAMIYNASPFYRSLAIGLTPSSFAFKTFSVPGSLLFSAGRYGPVGLPSVSGCDGTPSLLGSLQGRRISLRATWPRYTTPMRASGGIF